MNTAYQNPWKTARESAGLTQEAAAELVDVSVKSISYYESGARHMTPQVAAQLADAYAKFSKAFGRINPEYSGLSVALDTLKIVVDHLRVADPDALKALHPHLDEIGAIVGKRYGRH